MRLSNHLSRDLLDREFMGVAEIAGTRDVRWAFHQQFQPSDEIVDETKAAGLAACAVNRNRDASQRLHDETRDNTPIVLQHARAVCVKNAGDLDLNSMRTIVIEEEGFGGALALVVTGTRSDRVDVTGIALRLRVHLGITVDLAGRGLQNPTGLLPGQFEHVERANHTRLHRTDRIPLIVTRG